MTTQTHWPSRIVWHDLMTTDAAASKKFYCELFGWEIQSIPVQSFVYQMIQCGPGPIGGIVEEKKIPMSHWMPYIGVDDVDKTAEAIEAHGGSVCVAPTDIPNIGRFAVCGDPSGAYFSIYRGLPGAAHCDPDVMFPGRVCWNETYSTDAEAAQKFYTAIFGWQPTVKDMGPAGKYHMQMLGDKQAGGLMQQPMPGAPSCWVAYFLVQDLAASTNKAKALGAHAMMESMPIPGVGHFSMLMDPTGAMISLFEPSMEASADC